MTRASIKHTLILHDLCCAQKSGVAIIIDVIVCQQDHINAAGSKGIHQRVRRFEHGITGIAHFLTRQTGLDIDDRKISFPVNILYVGKARRKIIVSVFFISTGTVERTVDDDITAVSDRDRLLFYRFCSCRLCIL